MVLPLTRTQQCFFKMKRGNVVKVLKEVYLRDDIECGSAFCTVCKRKDPVLEKDAACYVIPDTNICLHQIDALESPAMHNVILLSVVLDEVLRFSPAQRPSPKPVSRESVWGRL